MKAAILAGGLGTRLAEETEVRPKPMVEIGGRPILWHVMKHFDFFGVREFCLALGYKGEVIKRFFLDYYSLNGSMTLDLMSGQAEVTDRACEAWRVHLVDTGQATLTGGRLMRMRPWLDGETFMLTYGDGVSDVPIDKLLAFHRAQGKLATVTAVRPPARFGGLAFEGDRIAEFTEKPQIGEGWINGGYMVFEPGIFKYLHHDETRLEQDVLEVLARQGQLVGYRHEGFWQCMDTLRDKWLLEGLWKSDSAPWKVYA